MKVQDNNGRGFLKEKLEGYQVDPPASVWNNIFVQTGGRKRRNTLMIALAAAASLALALSLGINYFGRDLPREVISESMEVPRKVDSETVQQAEKQSSLAETNQNLSSSAVRESLEEKVVNTLAQVASEPDLIPEPSEPDLIPEPIAKVPAQEEYPFEIGTPSISREMEPGLSPLNPVKDDPEQAIQKEVVLEVSSPEETPVDENPIQDKRNELADEPVLDLENGKARDPRWIVGAAVSPLYSFRDAAPEAMAGIPDYESGLLSYSGGIQVGYQTSRRLSVESGVFFNKMGITIGAPGIQLSGTAFDFAPNGQETERSNIIAISNSVGNIISKSGEIYVNNYKLNASYEANVVNDNFTSSVYADQGIRQHLDYLEIPLNVRYTVVDRSLKIQLVGGMSTNLLVNNYVTMETPDGPTEIGYLTNIRNVNYSGNAGIGFVYHFFDQLSLSLEPRFRYFMNSVNDDTLPSTRPYLFGLYTGINYFF